MMHDRIEQEENDEKIRLAKEVALREERDTEERLQEKTALDAERPFENKRKHEAANVLKSAMQGLEVRFEMDLMKEDDRIDREEAANALKGTNPNSI